MTYLIALKGKEPFEYNHVRHIEIDKDGLGKVYVEEIDMPVLIFPKTNIEYIELVERDN